MSDFATTYGKDPWGRIADKTRDVYVPDLLDVYKRQSMFRQFVPFMIDMGQAKAEVMTFTTMYDLLPDTTPLDQRQLWMDPFHTDSESKSIGIGRYGGKVAINGYDDMINQWRKGGVSDLRKITQGLLAPQMTETLELLARNAFLEGTWHMYGADGSKSNFAALDATNGADNFDPDISEEIWLGMQTRARSGAVDAAGNGNGGLSVIALTSPGVIQSIRQNPDFIDRAKYANPSALLAYEVGTYRGVRYLSHPSMYLWNTGDITFQGTVVEPIYPGTGAARNVDANRVVGQATMASGRNRYLQMKSTDNLSGIAVNDIVTIHTSRTNAFGVTNGVDYRDPSIVNARVVGVDNTTKRIELAEPVLRDMTTEIATDVYAYVTKAVTVSATAFLTGPNSVVAGVLRPPMMHVPQPVDDFELYYRFTWDARLKFQIWNDHAVEVIFNTAKHRVKGLSRY